MLPRSRIRVSAKALLAALLFAQAAVAAAACDWLRVAPAQALIAKANQPSCHEEPAGNANLCLAHCLSADQSADTPQVAIPACPHLTPLVVREIESTPSRKPALHFTLPRPGAPPPRILFHSFLI